MREIEKQLYNSERKKQIILLFAYIVNIIVVAIFLMISTGISNTVNESLNPSDYEQFIAILFSIISVCVVTILFFQWVISMLFSSLYDSRRTFNVNMRLAGMSKRSLYKIYIIELLRMQVIAIPAGLVFSWVVYSLIAKIFGLPSVSLNAISIVGAVVVHSIAIISSVTITFRKSNKLSPVELLRGKTHEYRRFAWSTSKIIKSIIGILIFLLVTLLPILDIDPMFVQPLRLSLLISYFFLQDLLFWLLDRVINLFSRLFGLSRTQLSRTLSEYSYNRTRALTNMIVFSVVLTIGLQSVYLSTRLAASEVSKENIHYDLVASFEEPFSLSAMQLQSSDLYTLKFIAGKTASGVIRAQGINSAFLDEYETINLDSALSDFNAEDLRSYIDDKDWNGVIFPQSFITPKDIGTTFTATINGKNIDFKIVAGYYTNNFSELRCIVSNAFLANALDLNDYANTVFSLDASFDSDLPRNAAILSNDELAQLSYDKVVSSTELVELSANIVLICALIMLMNYIFFISSEKRLDYVKLRAMGLSSSSANNVFIVHILQAVVFAIIIAIPLAGVFSAAACNILMSPYYYPNGITYPIVLIILETSILLILPALFFTISIRSANTNMVNQLRSMAEE